MKLKIKELREEYQLTQKELAAKIGNVQRNVSNWENGSSEPDLETIAKLADYFQISIDELFGRDAHAPFSIMDDEEQALYRMIKTLDSEQKAALLRFLLTTKRNS